MSDMQKSPNSYVEAAPSAATSEKHHSEASQCSSSSSSNRTAVIEIDFPPSYDAVHPIPHNYVPSVQPRIAETANSKTKIIPGQHVVGLDGFRTLYYAPDNSTLIKEDQKHKTHGIWATIAGTFIIASGLDLLWATFAFCYVVTTWTTAVVCIILPILGLPLYLLFAISWRALAHVDLILSTIGILQVLLPNSVAAQTLRPAPVDTLPRSPQTYHGVAIGRCTRRRSAPPLTKSDYTWRTAALTMFGLSTWRAIVYFTIPRIVLSFVAFCLFWLIIFPYWLLFGVGCLGFMWTPGATMWPMVKLMAAYPGLAVSLLSERKF
ncbi:hypothetical protein BJ742DRAFT_873809 [Cladochytrium replicatum]|nr:hypothetical protein BJ742DRAFT_873809 [Cladochytrium replicatum]